MPSSSIEDTIAAGSCSRTGASLFYAKRNRICWSWCDTSTGMRVKGDERILGSSDFVETVLKNAHEEYERRSRFRSRGLSLEKIIDTVSGYFEIKNDEIKSQSRQRAVARSRAVISHVAIEQMGFSAADVARALNVTSSAVSKLVLRARNEPILKEGINDVLNQF